MLASASEELQWSAGLTFANQELVIVDEANGALTPEAANHIDAHSILTHSWDFSALINVYCTRKRQRDRIRTKPFLFFFNHINLRIGKSYR